jgi:hypothetical protein
MTSISQHNKETYHKTTLVSTVVSQKIKKPPAFLKFGGFFKNSEQLVPVYFTS